MTLARKTKKTRLPSLVPPKDLRENTKARRAWLAAELARVTAQPGIEARIVAALETLQQCTQTRVAEKLGLRPQTLYNAVTRSNHSRLGRRRLHEMAALYRCMAADISEAANKLDQAAREVPPLRGEE
jgi:hypothetical protein